MWQNILTCDKKRRREPVSRHQRDSSVPITLAVIAFFSPAGICEAKPIKSALPSGFVYLKDVAPTILQDIRYATKNNFTGTVLPGYEAGECVLRQDVALALAKVQKKLKPQGYSLKTYDCYRPHRAVRAFGAWARDLSNQKSKDYYPRIAKSSLFARGYIARRSSHSQGAAIDLTLVQLPAQTQTRFDATAPRKACTSALTTSGDNSIAMGTSFDCFDVMSHTDNPKIRGKAHINRMRLRAIMTRTGFINYRKEWWHYSYKRHRYPHLFLDFPIRPRPKHSSK